ncbi:uncharacterized protein WM294_015103 [Sarcoramphus papa]
MQGAPAQLPVLSGRSLPGAWDSTGETGVRGSPQLSPCFLLNCTQQKKPPLSSCIKDQWKWCCLLRMDLPAEGAVGGLELCVEKGWKPFCSKSDVPETAGSGAKPSSDPLLRAIRATESAKEARTRKLQY